MECRQDVRKEIQQDRGKKKAEKENEQCVGVVQPDNSDLPTLPFYYLLKNDTLYFYLFIVNVLEHPPKKIKGPINAYVIPDVNSHPLQAFCFLSLEINDKNN